MVALLGMLVIASGSDAQTGTAAVNVSSVVRGGVVVVSYDLPSNTANAQFSVALEVSTDSGKTYSVHPKTVKGDIGPVVRAGAGKQIRWEAARDVENLEVDRYRYRVTATPVSGESGTARLSQTPVQTLPPAPSSGKGLKVAGIGAMAGGGVLFLMGMQKDSDCDVHGCSEYYPHEGLKWVGIAAAGAGGALFAIGTSKNDSGTHVVFRPGGVAIQKRVPLDRLVRTNR
jgi:hypothetical protein